MKSDVFALQLYSQLASQVPLLLVDIAGIIAVAVRRPAGTAWAIAGFALSAFVSVGAPIGQLVMLPWMSSAGASRDDITRALALVGLAWSVLRAISLGLLLAAILSPRRGAMPA